MKLSDLFGAAAVAPSRLRQEIFALGDRHQGDALAGARRELDDPRLSPERRSLLRAVVAHLSSGGTAGEGAVARAVRPASLSDAAYIGVIVAAAAWAIMIARQIFS